MTESVLVVGAGPTGLTAAVELARRNVPVRIIDKREGGSGLSRAVGIMPISLEILEASGATDKLLTEGARFQRLKVFKDSNSLAELKFKPTRIKHGYDFILGLAQDRTESILRECLKDLGVTVDYQVELQTLTQHENGVTVQLSNSQIDQYSYVVGADGARSTTRTTLGLDFPGIDLPEVWSIADVDASGWTHQDAFTVCLLSEGGVVVVAPLEATRYRVIANSKNALGKLPVPMNVTNIRREGEFTISVKQVSEYQVGRVFLAGDAAHCHSPVGGRGMNLGIADAADLARRIAERDTVGYGVHRHAEGAATIAGSERARKLITSSSGFVRAGTRGLLRLATRNSVLERRMADNFLYG